MKCFGKILIAFSLLISNLLILKSQPLLHPYNLDFEDAFPGYMPYGWVVPGYAQSLNYYAEASKENPASGKFCLMLSNNNKLEEGAYGSVMQSIDVKPYRGRRFLFNAVVRTDFEDPKSSAHLWAKVVRDNKQEGFFDWMQDNPIRTKEWSYFEIAGLVDEDANEMNFGLLLMGNGKAWIDKASITFFMKELPNYDSAYDISKKSLENLSALFKLFGFVRFFYPNDEYSAMDWEQFLLKAIPFIEKSNTSDELLSNLKKLFSPIAPELIIYSSQQKSDYKDYKYNKNNYIPNVALCCRHDGFPIQTDNQYISSQIVNIYAPQNRAEGAVVQILNAEKYRGKKLKFICMAKSDLYNSTSQGQLWLRCDLQGEKTIKVFTNDANPIVENQWKEYSIEADIPENASFIRLGLILLGDGTVWFDNAKVFIEERNKKLEEIEIKNPGFEQGNTGELVFGWKLASASEKAYYKAEITDDESFMGKKSLKLSSDKENIIKLPYQGELFKAKIHNDIEFIMPLTLLVDSNGTLPKPAFFDNSIPSTKPDDFILSPEDRTSRLTVVAIFWNLIKHFSYSLPNNIDMDSVLEQAIIKASKDKNSDEFYITLKNIAQCSNDNLAKVWYGKKDVLYRFPFLWELINNKIIITKVYDSLIGVDIGDEVLEINNKNLLDSLNFLIDKNIGINQNTKIAKILEEIRSGDFRSTAIFKIKKYDGNIVVKKLERNITQNELIYKTIPSLFEIKNNIFYVDLTKFDDRQFKDELKQLVSAKGIIFDLRGFSSISDHFLGFFIRKPLESIKTLIPVYTKPNRELISSKIVKTLITPKVLPSNPVVVFLMNEYSSGNSETLLNIIREYGIAEIVGRESSGSGGESIQFRLGADFYAAMTTIFPLDKQNKILLNRTIKPTIKIERTIQDIMSGRDEILENAYEYLMTKIH